MQVTVNHTVYNSEDAIKFVSRFQGLEVVDARIEQCYKATGSKYYQIQVQILAVDAEQIDCGDHLYEEGVSYPQDLLVTCHRHE